MLGQSCILIELGISLIGALNTIESNVTVFGLIVSATNISSEYTLNCDTYKADEKISF